MSKSRKSRKEMWQQRRRRTQKGLAGSRVERLTVFRSARHIYAQLDDAETGKTLISISTRSKGILGEVAASGGVEAARKVGEAIAAAAKERNIERVVFNRNGYLFHGRVKALADAAREAGLKF